MGRLRQAISQANAAAIDAQNTLHKADTLLDEVIDLLDRFEDEGIEISIELAGHDLPIIAKIKLPSVDEKQANQT